MIYTQGVNGVVDRCIALVDFSPWTAHAGCHAVRARMPEAPQRAPLYTAEQRRRRDSSQWTLVQGVLAPVQFAVFLVSLYFVVRYLLTGDGLAIATASIVAKTLILYAIMVTGSLWEKDVFGRYLFARPFFWEDVVSMLVLALHTAYLAALLSSAIDTDGLMYLALAAYASYVVNAAQFVLKLRAARRQQAAFPTAHGGMVGAAE